MTLARRERGRARAMRSRRSLFYHSMLRFALLRRSAMEDIIVPFYGDDVPRQNGGLWRQSFQDLEHQSRSAMPLTSSPRPSVPSTAARAIVNRARHTQNTSSFLTSRECTAGSHEETIYRGMVHGAGAWRLWARS